MAARSTSRGSDRDSKSKSPKGGSGVSFRTKEAISVGLFGSGPAVVKRARYEEYDYGGTVRSRNLPVVLLVTFWRSGEADYEQPYSLGNGWEIENDGLTLVPKAGQTGIPNSSNAYLFMESMEEATGKVMDADDVADVLGKLGDDASVIEGMEIDLIRKPQPERGLSGSGGGGGRGRGRDDDRGRGRDRDDRGGRDGGSESSAKTILLINEILQAPGSVTEFEDDDRGKGKGKGKDKTPSRRGKDEEEEEKPARGRGRDKDDDDEPKGSAKGKGKAKDDEEVDDDEVKEILLEALGKAGGSLKLDKVEEAVFKAARGNPLQKEIAERASEDDFIDLQDGWTFDEKKKIVEVE